MHAGISNPLKTVGNLQHWNCGDFWQRICREKTPKVLGLYCGWGSKQGKGAWETAYNQYKHFLLRSGLQSSCSKAVVLKRPAPAEQEQGTARTRVLLVSSWPLGLRCRDRSPELIYVRTSTLLLQVCLEGQDPESCIGFWAGTLWGSKAEDGLEARPLIYFKINSVFGESDLQ